mmetsp:Transcript_38657/g.84835  ORF Transcript_38657/g.84835 Transcript_38657/m.84835 type:complete len:92 (+) Transcript_38657:244-519(+)
MQQQQQQQQPQQEPGAESSVGQNEDEVDGKVPASESAPAAVPFANDGSFLEMMKRKLAEEQAAKDESGDAADAQSSDKDEEKQTAPLNSGE